MGTRYFHDYDDAHHYNYGEGISYPHGYNQYGDAGHHLTKRPVSANEIYSPALKLLSKQTEYNLNNLKQKLCKTDPCYEYGMQHWHTDQKKKEVDVAWKNEDLPQHARPQWETTKNMFASRSEMNKINFNATRDDDDVSSVQSNASTPVPVCYLCSTLEEHQQHLVRRGPQLKEKNVPKPRVKYVAPPPLVKMKEEEIEEKKECLYKVNVVTGKLYKSGTSALVTIVLKGQRGVMQKKELKKKRTNFTFGVGTSEVFFIKGPDLGDLRSLVVEHNGLEQRHGWFLEYIEVYNMTNNKCWVFECRNWLSLYDGDGKVRRVLRAQAKDMTETEYKRRKHAEYEITVVTADKKLAGTDANVYITLYGKTGFTPKEKLERKGKDLFEKGQKDKFTLVTKDLGPLTSIKLEHDNSGIAPGWLVEQVIVHDVGLDVKYVFPVGQWLATSEGDGSISRVLYPLTTNAKKKMSKIGLMSSSKRKTRNRHDDVDEEAHREQTYYQVTTLTGNKSYAGTDAKVYIQMYGKHGTTHEEYLPDDSSQKFEKGSTDVFKFRATNVGNIKKLRIRHDNSGLGAGWFLEQVIVRRFFSQHEIDKKLSKLQEEIDQHVNRRVSEISGKDIEDVENESSRRRSIKSSGKGGRMATLEEEEEVDERRGNKSRQSDRDSLRESRKASRRSSRKYSDDSGEDSDVEIVNNRKKGRRVQRRYVVGVKEFILTETETESECESDDRSSQDKRKKHRRGKYDSDSSDDAYGKRDKKDQRKGKYGYDEDSDGGYRKKKGPKAGRGNVDSEEDSDEAYQKLKRRLGRESELDNSNERYNRKQKKNRVQRDSSEESESDDDHYGNRGKKSNTRRNKQLSESESDSDEPKKKSKSRRTSKRHSSRYNDEEESFAVTKVWKKDRIPYCEEYTFPCHKWLAEDEDDGAIERILKPESCTIFYKMARK